ncbi:hypothetical protein RB195_002906 [Necator americanus]|uniref:Uncharacterized protein n=1 Tax=Necator americanus TaxID=51031 RepID=A0ABR1DP11_NECAM
MFYFLALSFVILSVFTKEGVSGEYKPCLDKAGSSFCIKPYEEGMCHHEAVEELMKEVHRLSLKSMKCPVNLILLPLVNTALLPISLDVEQNFESTPSFSCQAPNRFSCSFPI